MRGAEDARQTLCRERSARGAVGLLVAPSSELLVVVRFGASVLETRRLAPPRSFEVVNASGALVQVPVEDVGDRARVMGRSLERGARLELPLDGVSVEVSLHEAVEATAGKPPIDRRTVAAQAISALVHAATLAALVAFLPPVEDDEPLAIERDAIAHVLAPKGEEGPARDRADDERASVGEGQAGGRASIAVGAMGERTSERRARAYGLAGEASRRAPSGDRPAIDPTTFGIIHVISIQLGADPHVGGWGALPSGSDALSASGELWGPEVGDARGAGGLGMTGIGEGGGGLAHGVGLHDFGGFGRGEGTCDAACRAGLLGHGRGTGRLGGSHRVGGVLLCGEPVDAPREGCTTSVTGRLPPEVIQRVMRQNFGRLRLCYEEGLRPQPSLAGRVTVKFVIARDGSVASAQNGGSDLPDASVVACVVRAVGGLSFPEPEGGVVHVSYPITFSPGE